MDSTDQQIFVLWFLTGIAVAIMLLRLVLLRIRKKAMDIGGYLTIVAIISVLFRGAVVHVTYVWGTNSVTGAQRATLTHKQIYQHETGGKLNIVNRVIYTEYTWVQKCVVMFVIQGLFSGIGANRVLNVCWGILAVTFIVSLIACFVDCHPFSLYWQVIPDPGDCGAGNIQLIVFSALEMATDLMLMLLPLPKLWKIQRPLASKIRLIVLFMVGLCIIAVTLLRLLLNELSFHRAGESHNVANVEIFAAAFVANAPTIYGLLGIEGKVRNRSTRSYLPASSQSMNNDPRYLVRVEGNVELEERYSNGRNTMNPMRFPNDSDEEPMVHKSSARTKECGLRVMTKSLDP